MGNIVRRTKSELRLLPLMLMKLLGGVLTVVGATTAMVIATRNPAPTGASMAVALILGGVGIIVFLLSARLLNKHPVNEAKDRARMSVLAWGLFLLCIVMFLACVWFATR
jgi:hypothetical protein